MKAASTVLNRMRHVAFALLNAAEHNVVPSRIQIQKFVYLMDVLCPIFDQLPPVDGYVTYKRGPYDSSVQNAVDALAFRGLADIVSIQALVHGQTAALYALNNFGKQWASRLAADPNFATEWRVAAALEAHLKTDGWKRIVSLVYAEPTYLQSKSRGWGQTLDSTDGLIASAAFVTATIENSLMAGFSKGKMSPQLLLSLFFEYLDKFSKAYPKSTQIAQAQ